MKTKSSNRSESKNEEGAASNTYTCSSAPTTPDENNEKHSTKSLHQSSIQIYLTSSAKLQTEEPPNTNTSLNTNASPADGEK